MERIACVFRPLSISTSKWTSAMERVAAGVAIDEVPHSNHGDKQENPLAVVVPWLTLMQLFALLFFVPLFAYDAQRTCVFGLHGSLDLVALIRRGPCVHDNPLLVVLAGCGISHRAVSSSGCA